ncbi:MAG: hypothetical protein HY260_16680 [Chloroflexi bacterium]|nr:hypothetical protein [Chloroflexota bacterium]
MKTRVPSFRRLARLAVPIGLTAAAALLWLSQFLFTFAGLSSPDQLDYAQIACHVWRGEGFVTSIAHPLTFSRFDSPVQQDFLRITLFLLLYVGQQDRYQRGTQYESEYSANAGLARYHQPSAVSDSARLYRYEPPGSPPACA